MGLFNRIRRQEHPASLAPTPPYPQGRAPERIEIAENGITLNGHHLPELTIDALAPVIGVPRIVPPATTEPDEHGLLPNTLLIWDAAGIWGYTKDGVTVNELAVRLAADPEWEARPSHNASKRPSSVFGGRLTVNGREPLDAVPEHELSNAYMALDVESGSWRTTFLLTKAVQGAIRGIPAPERAVMATTGGIADMVRSAATPFREVAISQQHEAVVPEYPAAPAADGPALVFDHLMFKLAVVQQLMYEQDLLTPRFDVHAFLASNGAPAVDILAQEAIPAVRDWFDALEIAANLADRVEELTLDGGNDIYLQLVPQWDGEDNQFLIERMSARELAQFPKLSRVLDIGGFLGPDARETLAANGVELGP